MTYKLYFITTGSRTRQKAIKRIHTVEKYEHTVKTYKRDTGRHKTY